MLDLISEFSIAAPQYVVHDIVSSITPLLDHRYSILTDDVDAEALLENSIRKIR